MISDFDFRWSRSRTRKAEKLPRLDPGPKGALCILFGAQGGLVEAENVARQTLALDPLGVIAI